MLAAARRSTFPWKWTRIGKSEDHTDDQPFNMLIFRIVFSFFFSLLLSPIRCTCHSLALFYFRSVGVVVMIPKTVCADFVLSSLLWWLAEQPKTDINVVYLKWAKGLTNDNGELHPNGVNIKGDNKKNIFEYVVFGAFTALPTPLTVCQL